MPGYKGSTQTSFPQVSDNRSLGALVTELAQYSGGEDRTDIQDKARSSIFAAIRQFNQVYWTFNVLIDDLTLSSPNAVTDADFDLTASFYRQYRAQMVDSSSKTRDRVQWVEWEDWTRDNSDQSTTGSIPLLYTARNIHERGVVTVDPPPASTLTYPTLRLFYFRQIASPSGDGDSIDCPSVVEQARLDLAVFICLSMVRGFREAREARGEALLSRAAVEREYRGHEDF